MEELNLEEIHRATFDLLCKFHKICDDNGFKYYLAYGTLLGAIRHKGFIPWDDDVDVWMPRADFQKFTEYCIANHELLSPLRLCNRSNTRNYYYGVTRFVDTSYKYEVKGHEKPFDLGTFIDIYPLDNFGNSQEEANIILKKTNIMNRLYSAYVNPKGRNIVLSIIRPPLHLYTRLKNGPDYNKKIDKEIERFILNNTSDNDVYVGCPACSLAKRAVIYPKEYFNDRIKTEFEGEYFYIPIGWERILKIEFNDYLQLPPIEDRHPYHSYRIFRL